MSRESRIFFSRLIVAGIFALSIIAAILAHFLVTLISVAGGILVWLLYLLSAGLGTEEEDGENRATIGRNISKVLAGLGAVLAISAFNTYGIEQTMWGTYLFNVQGLAIAMLILLITISPLVILQLTSAPGSHTSQAASDLLMRPPPPQPYYPPVRQPEEPYEDEGEYYDEDEDEYEDEDEDEEYDDDDGEEEKMDEEDEDDD
ncbi:MAG: hypothetical protein IIA59_02945 [Candidatus Marinimicrobia bacterium]|nr:hypothetical protein [Candidatus Neomarinimicrobiota bacterium]